MIFESINSLLSLFPSFLPCSCRLSRADGRVPFPGHAPLPHRAPVRSTSAAPVASRTLHAALFPSAHAEDDRRRATATNGPMQCREPIHQPLAPSPGFPPSLCFANEPPSSPSTSLPAPGSRPSCLRCPGPPLAPPPLGFRGAHPSALPRAPQTMDGSGSGSGRVSVVFGFSGFGFGFWFSPADLRVRVPEIFRVWNGSLNTSAELHRVPENLSPQPNNSPF